MSGSFQFSNLSSDLCIDMTIVNCLKLSVDRSLSRDAERHGHTDKRIKISFPDKMSHGDTFYQKHTRFAVFQTNISFNDLSLTHSIPVGVEKDPENIPPTIEGINHAKLNNKAKHIRWKGETNNLLS